MSEPRGTERTSLIESTCCSVIESGTGIFVALIIWVTKAHSRRPYSGTLIRPTSLVSDRPSIDSDRTGFA